MLDGSGKVVKTFATPGRAKLLAVSDGRVVATANHGKIVSFDVK